MTTEQNESQAQPSQGQVQAQGPSQGATAGQNQGHRRRRRKRNKGQGKQQAGGAPPNGAAQQNGTAAQGSPQQNGTHPQQGQKPKKRFFKNHNPGNGNGGNYQNNGNGNGNYQSNGNGRMGSNGNGGGRRKGKQRRQQVFVGPMDHSYRVANGNVADLGTNNSQAEFRGMPHSGFYPESDFYSPAPVPVREDAPTRIYFFIEDLFFVAKIQEASKKLGIKVGFLKAGKETLAQLTDVADDARPSLIVFDLNNPNMKPLTMIPKLKAKLKRGTSVVGFLSHLQGDLKVKAIEAGCDMVMPRSAFSQNLPNLLRRHGLEEEEEMETMQA